MGVTIERNATVGTVVIDRPAVRNAVDGRTAEALYGAFLELDHDDSISVCVLWGSGGTFCSGADMRAIGSDQTHRLEADGHGPMGPTRLAMSKPVIAAIEGHAVAGGLELALWCDLRVGSEMSVFGVLCRRWGVPLIDGGTVRLPQIVGVGHAMDMILTGREVSAREAKDIGLINRIVPEGSARKEAEALARTIAAFPQICLRSDRRALREGVGAPTDEAMRREFELGMETIASGETMAGVERFRDGHGRNGAPE
ncbi:MAG: crotonase/enoyl-CoA hydratase family protein [Actinomycetota bacterium]|nr:crotonase/enoyl-CoA hydratase family protein [Actinomycetota bacterium]